MPFPAGTPALLDPFTGAPGALDPSWNNIDGAGTFNDIAYSGSGTTGVRFDAVPAFAWGYYVPNLLFGPDCECFVTLPVVGVTQTIRIGARGTGMGTGLYSGYLIHINGADGVWTVRRETNGGAPVTLATGATQALAAGDSVGIQIIGTIITGWYKPGAGAWVQEVSYDVAPDPTKYLAAGAFMLEFQAQEVDNFMGDTISSGGGGGDTSPRIRMHRQLRPVDG